MDNKFLTEKEKNEVISISFQEQWEAWWEESKFQNQA